LPSRLGYLLSVCTEAVDYDVELINIVLDAIEEANKAKLDGVLQSAGTAPARLEEA